MSGAEAGVIDVEGREIPPQEEAIENGAEAVEEMSFIERTQHRLASVRARLMRPSLRNGFGLFTYGDRQEYKAAKEANKLAMLADIHTSVSEYIDEQEERPSDEDLLAFSTMKVIENKHAIDELTVSEEYAGKQTNGVIQWIREKSFRTKTASSGALTLFGGIFGFGWNTYVAHKLGSGNVADGKDRILATAQQRDEALREEAAAKEGTTEEVQNWTISESYRQIDQQTDEELLAVSKDLGATALGSFLGFGGSAVLNAA